MTGSIAFGVITARTRVRDGRGQQLQQQEQQSRVKWRHQRHHQPIDQQFAAGQRLPIQR